MQRFGSVVAISALLASITVHAADFESLDDGPLHEAFVSQTQGSLVVQATEKAPPAPLKEQVGPSCDKGTDWIPGYWMWSDDTNDFVWVSGTWRRSPPGRQWISGSWKELDEGWVWIRGFWSAAAPEDLHALNKMPPDPLQEEARDAPDEGMFWMPGYWAHSKDNTEFRWYSGQWEKVDDDWVFVPAHWVWRPDGYVFVSAFWDYPLEERGCVYPPIKVGEGIKKGTYEVEKPLESDAVLKRLLPRYPDYASFFQQHYLTHPNFWHRYMDTPPWWSWSSWWTQTWWDQWAVFWWWTHPGYPQPGWITITTSTRIWPPPAGLIRRMNKRIPPFVVTPEGVVTPAHVLKETARITERRIEEMPPVLPAKTTIRETIEKASEPRDRKGVRPLRPSGSPPGPGENVEQPGPKANLKSETSAEVSESRPQRIPQKPQSDAHHPLRKQGRLEQPMKEEKDGKPEVRTAPEGPRPAPKSVEDESAREGQRSAPKRVENEPVREGPRPAPKSVEDKPVLEGSGPAPKRSRAAPASGSGDHRVESLKEAPQTSSPTPRGTQAPDSNQRSGRTPRGPSNPENNNDTSGLRHRRGREVEQVSSTLSNQRVRTGRVLSVVVVDESGHAQMPFVSSLERGKRPGSRSAVAQLDAPVANTSRRPVVSRVVVSGESCEPRVHAPAAWKPNARSGRHSYCSSSGQPRPSRSGSRELSVRPGRQPCCCNPGQLRPSRSGSRELSVRPGRQPCCCNPGQLRPSRSGSREHMARSSERRCGRRGRRAQANNTRRATQRPGR